MVGLRIRALRLTRGISQEALGRELGITFQQIQKYEKGANRVSASRLHQIAAVLQVRVAELIDPDARDLSGTGYPGDEVLSSLALAGAVRLLRAFAQIESRALRAMLVDNAEIIAQESQLAQSKAGS